MAASGAANRAMSDVPGVSAGLGLDGSSFGNSMSGFSAIHSSKAPAANASKTSSAASSSTITTSAGPLNSTCSKVCITRVRRLAETAT